MYSVIIDNNLEEESSKNRIIKVNFGKLYLILLILSFALIYFYGIYQSNYLTILVPYRVLWPVLIIFIGISMLRVKNTGAFSLAFFITTLSVGITITSIFTYSSNIQNNINTSIIPIKDTKELAFDINFTSTQAKIISEASNIFKGNFSSNYDTLISSNYMNENQVENIKLEQNSLPPGIGSYIKSSDIIFPTSIPIELKLNSNLSSLDINFNNIKLKSGDIKLNNSVFDMIIKDINLNDDVVLDISSNLSRLNIIISKDIPIIISNSSGLSQTEFIGVNKSDGSSNVYQTLVQESIPDQDSYSDEISEIEPNTEQEKEIKESKKLIINLKSTLSSIKITQK